MAGARAPGATDTTIVAGAKVLVVEARYYDAIADELLRGARRVLDDANVETTLLTVPGALEIPGAIAIAIDSGRGFEAAVALGCVIRGETSHYDIVAGESARALMDLSTGDAFPVGNGIVTVDTMGQALARSRVAEGNKGAAAAEAALAGLAIKRRLASGRRR